MGYRIPTARMGGRPRLRHARLPLLALVAMLWLAGASSQESQRWITDQFEVTLRTGKSTQQSIVRLLPSGTRVELLETDADAGYSRVRTSAGAEGWVLSRYLVNSPPPNVMLPSLKAQLQKAQQDQLQLTQRSEKLRQENAGLQGQVAKLEQTNQDLQKQLDEIRRLSSSTVQLNEQNKRLRQSLAERDKTMEQLKADNRRLSSRARREWFVLGAGVLVFGLLLGLILPRIRWRRKSSWSDF